MKMLLSRSPFHHAPLVCKVVHHNQNLGQLLVPHLLGPHDGRALFRYDFAQALFVPAFDEGAVLLGVLFELAHRVLRDHAQLVIELRRPAAIVDALKTAAVALGAQD